ncbi:outer membrane protein assembly factor BamB family protein [Gordonia aurantiaca]|uniref:outer membrane protein assembly factor BamB family protein n=1 Tax=Gordonia sp. B21 TaxID=3151852 RepID=UPI003267E754
MRRPVAAAAALAAGVAIITACGSDDSGTPDVATVSPATAVEAPAASNPVGTTVPAPAGARALASSGSTVAVVSPDGNQLLRYDTASITAPPTPIGVPGLTALAPDADGGYLAAGPGTLVVVDATGQVRIGDLDTDSPTAIVRAAGGQIVVGTSDGRILIYDEDFQKKHDAREFVRVDSLTAAPASAEGLDGQVVVLDRAQSSVTPIDPADGDPGPALRAGNGATTSTVDRFGRILVANTRDGEILGFYGSPLVMRFRYPVADGPYAVDYDDTRNVLWVSTTGNNEVVAYDLADGEPTEKQRFASVVQPDRITVDDKGTVYVLSARDGLLQVVPQSDTPLGVSPAEPGR